MTPLSLFLHLLVFQSFMCGHTLSVCVCLVVMSQVLCGGDVLVALNCKQTAEGLMTT